jgi:hypothetical protein
MPFRSTIACHVSSAFNREFYSHWCSKYGIVLCILTHLLLRHILSLHFMLFSSPTTVVGTLHYLVNIPRPYFCCPRHHLHLVDALDNITRYKKTKNYVKKLCTPYKTKLLRSTDAPDNTTCVTCDTNRIVIYI